MVAPVPPPLCRHPPRPPPPPGKLYGFFDIAQRQWTDIAIEYITSGVAFKTKPVDPEVPEGAVEIMRAPTGDIMTTSKSFKDLAISISRDLNATPNAVTPGVSVVGGYGRTASCPTSSPRASSSK